MQRTPKPGTQKPSETLRYEALPGGEPNEPKPQTPANKFFKRMGDGIKDTLKRAGEEWRRAFGRSRISPPSATALTDALTPPGQTIRSKPKSHQIKEASAPPTRPAIDPNDL